MLHHHIDVRDLSGPATASALAHTIYFMRSQAQGDRKLYIGSDIIHPVPWPLFHCNQPRPICSVCLENRGLYLAAVIENLTGQKRPRGLLL